MLKESTHDKIHNYKTRQSISSVHQRENSRKENIMHLQSKIVHWLNHRIIPIQKTPLPIIKKKKIQLQNVRRKKEEIFL